jgi:hypothetical protein
MMRMISPRIRGHGVGAVFLLPNSQRAAETSDNAPSHAAYNSTHEAADRSKDLIPGVGTSTGTITGAWRDALSVRSGRYGSERDYANDKFQHRLIPPVSTRHRLVPPVSNMCVRTLASQ